MTNDLRPNVLLARQTPDANLLHNVLVAAPVRHLLLIPGLGGRGGGEGRDLIVSVGGPSVLHQVNHDIRLAVQHLVQVLPCFHSCGPAQTVQRAGEGNAVGRFQATSHSQALGHALKRLAREGLGRGTIREDDIGRGLSWQIHKRCRTAQRNVARHRP